MSTRRRSTRQQKKEKDSSSDIMIDTDTLMDDLGMETTPTLTQPLKSLASKNEETEHQKDKVLLEFLDQLEDYRPMIPDAAMDYYLQKAGFDCPDDRIKRLLALAAQKFVSDISQDAFQYSKLRQQSSSARDKKSSANKKTILTMDDLSSALAEYGINTKKPDFYV